MAAPRCRHCQVILLDHEENGDRCPCCNGALQDAPPPPPARSRRLWLVLAVPLLGCVAVAAYFAWPRPASPSNESPAPIAQRPDPSASRAKPRPPVVVKQPHPKQAVALVEPPAGELILAPLRRDEDVVAQAEILPPPSIEQTAQQRPLPVEGKEVVKTLVLDRPNEIVTLESVNGDSHLRVTGRVRMLRLTDVDGEAVIDASKLQAERVIVLGKIMGKTKVFLRAGYVEIRKGIHGDSDLMIDAGDGVVVFGKKGGVHGASRVVITARYVDLVGPLTGGTLTKITLSPRGVLSFRYADGGARLEYRKSSEKDEDPTIHRGEVRGGAKVRQVK